MIERLTAIASKYLGLETLEDRNSDRLDFKEQAVWNVRLALIAAYNAGLEQGKYPSK
jgi:hypothetical protein